MAQLPGSQASDFWWLRPAPPDNPLPAMQLGAQIRQRVTADAIAMDRNRMEQERLNLMTRETLYKERLQNQIMSGSEELAQTLSDPAFDWNDPESIKRGYEVFSKHPTLMGTGVYQGFEKNVFNASEARRKADAQASRERMFENRLKVLGEHYENQDEVARLRLEWQQLRDTEESIYKYERLRQIDEELRRLEGDQRLRAQELERKKGLMKPEQRQRYKAALDAVENTVSTRKDWEAAGVKTRAEYDALKRREVDRTFFGDAPITPAPQSTPQSKPLTKELATKFLEQAGGDKNKARQLAREAGYDF